jgi:hypothetical protein
LCGGPVSWGSRKQNTVATSTTEAEYMSASQAAKEAMWLRYLLKELGYPQEGPTVIWEDNKGCIDLSRNPVFHKRSKHIDVQHHYVRERVECQEIKLAKITGEENIADLFTKALPRDRFHQLRGSLMDIDDDTGV